MTGSERERISTIEIVQIFLGVLMLVAVLAASLVEIICSCVAPSGMIQSALFMLTGLFLASCIPVWFWTPSGRGKCPRKEVNQSGAALNERDACSPRDKD